MKVIQCDLYLLAVRLADDATLNIDVFAKDYDKIMETAKVLGLALHGRDIGVLEWIIGELLWSKGDKFKKRALDIHLRKGYV